MKTNRLSRKEFILGIAGGGIALVVGCGDDETGTTDAASSGAGAAGAAGATTSGPGPSSSSGAGGMSSSSGGGGTGPGGSGQGGSGGGGSAMCGAVVSATIFQPANHGHKLDVPLADIDAAVDKTYDITGTAMHCHQVTLTAADFMTLKTGGVVKKKTCNGTDHELVLSCASDPPAPAAPDCAATPSEGTCM